MGPCSSYRCSNLYPVLRDIPNSRHKSDIRSPAFSRATNSIRSFTAVTSFQGMGHPPHPYICYLCVRTAPNRVNGSLGKLSQVHVTSHMGQLTADIWGRQPSSFSSAHD